MLLETSGGRPLHLGYCFNVLPGETATALHQQLDQYCKPLRERLAVGRMGVGLWIAHGAAAELVGTPGALDELRRALDRAGLYVFTLNGFPYGGFHAPRVKERVFLPDWSAPERLRYSLDLAEILARLLPDDVDEGTISTVPLGPASVDVDAARAQLGRAAEELAALAARVGRRVRLCLEPEPGAALERASAAAALLAELDHGEHLGVCFDTCHAAVVGEAPEDAWRDARARRVRWGKIQISSALVVPDPRDPAQRQALADFDEPRFYHQVRSDDGGRMDIPDALADLGPSSPWRVHFHVPVHRGAFAPFGTTAANIHPTLAAVLAATDLDAIPHLEVETYTWNVLPEQERPRSPEELVDGLARELRWTLDVLATSGARPRE